MYIMYICRKVKHQLCLQVEEVKMLDMLEREVDEEWR
jgi:hypothetical protein